MRWICLNDCGARLLITLYSHPSQSILTRSISVTRKSTINESIVVVVTFIVMFDQRLTADSLFEDASARFSGFILCSNLLRRIFSLASAYLAGKGSRPITREAPFAAK